MAPIPWQSIRSLLLFFGPILLPKAIQWYRSVRNAERPAGVHIQPVPNRIRIALAVLLGLVVVSLVKTLPAFAPENVFTATDSRLQIPVDVLFNRVASGRPDATLTLADERLRARFVNLESRLLYIQYGPSVLADCPFCASDAPNTYFHYAVPALLAPHIMNLVAIAVSTSPSLTGRHGAQWRTMATMAAIALAAFEVYVVATYNYQANARALRLHDIDFFFWSVRTYRLCALALLDGLLAWLLYMSSTNRAFVKPPVPAERVEGVTRSLGMVKSKLSAMGIVRNTVVRDEDLRARSQAYWSHEVNLMREVMEEREVVEGVRDALSNRINIQSITNDADKYTQMLLQQL